MTLRKKGDAKKGEWEKEEVERSKEVWEHWESEKRMLKSAQKVVAQRVEETKKSFDGWLAGYVSRQVCTWRKNAKGEQKWRS